MQKLLCIRLLCLLAEEISGVNRLFRLIQAPRPDLAQKLTFQRELLDHDGRKQCQGGRKHARSGQGADFSDDIHQKGVKPSAASATSHVS